MYSDQERPSEMSSPSPLRADAVRRRVVEAVSGTRLPAQATDRAHLDVYLSLLQDRLPAYVGMMSDILGYPGRSTVRENLSSAARATIGFYEAVLPAKTSVVSNPSQLVRLRHMMRSGRLGPHQADIAVADYLRREQELGRVGADVHTLNIARLLIGGCLGYAFNWMLMGGEDLPPSDEYATGIAYGLRLEH